MPLHPLLLLCLLPLRPLLPLRLWPNAPAFAAAAPVVTAPASCRCRACGDCSGPVAAPMATAPAPTAAAPVATCLRPPLLPRPWRPLRPHRRRACGDCSGPRRCRARGDCYGPRRICACGDRSGPPPPQPQMRPTMWSRLPLPHRRVMRVKTPCWQ